MHQTAHTSSDTYTDRPPGGRRLSPGFAGMLERIRYDGAYATRAQAERATRPVLAALGRQLAAPERRELAAVLPPEAAEVLVGEPVAKTPLGPLDFVREIAEHSGGTPATARWAADAVCAQLAGFCGPDLTGRVVDGLPSGYAALFGRVRTERAAA
ncbi:DUF2267 domain-containing protein [Streptomyces sp. NPDC006798]|uniref:DUF2267 domain-containing protein n=1 Tax=Streptomyces sp. NPDC006798 TaxID=3155462 RepID=UPI0033E337B0